MGKLARRCRFLADGIQLDETWRLLLSREFLFAACKAAVNSDDISELEEAYSLLSCPSAYENAQVAHQDAFNFNSGTGRLDRIRQSLACARFAACCRQPMKSTANQELAVWTPRALGLDSPMDSLELTLVETTETVVDRALAAATNHTVDVAFARALAREFLGIVEQRLTTLKIPILLFDRIGAAGKLAWLYLQKRAGGIGRFYPAPQANLCTEIAEDTRQGTLDAWSYASSNGGPLNFDVQWWLDGTDSIAGRSVDGAFAVGLRLLVQDAPYDSSCVITATVNADNLGVVGGLCEPGNPKLVAAQALRRDKTVSVVVAEATPLSDADRTQWQSKGIEIVKCLTVDDALRVASRQVQILDDFLANQITHILAQASRRFERAITSPLEMDDLIVAMRVARGVRTSVSESDLLEVAQASSITTATNSASLNSPPDDDANSNREVLSWDKFIKQTASHAIVLGDPGFGKTTLLWQLVANQCDAARQRLRSLDNALSELTFSVFIPAAALSDSLSNAQSTSAKVILDCIASLYAMDSQIAAMVEQKILSGQCVVCLDALDEVTDLRALTNYLASFVRENTNAKILLTSRLSGYVGPPFEISENSQAELLPFTNAQIREAIEVWFQHDANLRDSITRQVRKSKHLHDVLRSPILLHLACRQVLQSIEKQKALPTWERRSELYEGFVLLALEQLEKRTHQPVTQMERFEFRVFLGELALSLWKKDPKRAIWSCNQIHQAIKEVVVGKLYGLQNRFPQLLDDLQDSGLMVPVSAGESLAPMMFLHRTVGEYLAGHQLARRISEDGCSETWALIEKKSWDPAWRELIMFLAGNLADAKSLLDRLCEPQATADNPHGDDLLRHRLMLAAQCLPEINLSKYAGSAREIAESVICVVRSLMSATSLEEVVNALSALFLFNSMLEESQRIPDLHRRIPMVERVLPRIGAAAATQDLEFWLVEKLWRACESHPTQSTRSRSAPQPIANALVSVFDKVDLARVRSFESGDDATKWRVCGALLRAASELDPSSVQLTSELLRALGSSLFQSAQVNSIGLRQTIKYLPKVDSITLENSGLLEQCCFAIKSPIGEDAKRAFCTLGFIG
jgi:NACHT domain